MQQQALSGKSVINKLVGYFEMLFDFKDTCTKLPYFSFLENMELRVLANEMTNLYLPVVDQWKIIENYRKNKYKLGQ